MVEHSLSPAHIARLYRKATEGVCRILDRTFVSRPFAAILVCLILAVAVLGLPGFFRGLNDLKVPEVQQSMVYLLLFRHPYLLCALFLSHAALRVQRRYLNGESILWIGVVLVLSTVFAWYGESADRIAISIAGTALALGAVFAVGHLARARSDGQRILLGFAVGLGVNFLYQWFSTQVTPIRPWLNIRMLPLISMIFVVDPGFRKSLSASLRYLFGGFHFLAPVSLSSTQMQTRSEKAYSKGFWDIFLSFTFSLFATVCALMISEENGLFAFGEHLILQGFIKYMYYYFSSCAWIGFSVGAARMMGLDLPDYFAQPLLATNPFDRWRRWNTYFYNLTFSLIYFPILRVVPSVFLAVFVVFLFSWSVHVPPSQVFEVFTRSFAANSRTFWMGLFFFLSHGLLVYIGLKTRNLWPSETRKLGWLGVLVMTFLMSVLHLIAPK